jgi:hypothetical protein
MKSSLVAFLLLLAAPVIAQEQSQPHDPSLRWTRAQKYAAEGFKPVDCFAGQVRIRGKRLTGQTFSIYAPNGDMKCCGSLLKSARTDNHGHFFVEPLKEGKYFAQFDFRSALYSTNFAIIKSYERCTEATHIEIDFSDANDVTIQSFVDINDSGEECKASEPNCFRK